MQSPKQPTTVDLKQGGYLNYEPCMKFRFIARFLPRQKNDATFLIQRITNVTDLKKEIPHSPVKEVIEPVVIDYLNTKRYMAGPGKVVKEAVPSPPFKQTLEIVYALGPGVPDLGEQIGDRRHLDILLLDPAGGVMKVIKIKFDRYYLTIPDLDYSLSELVTRKIILCDVSEFVEALPNNDAYVIYKEGAAEVMFDDKEEAEDWLTIDLRSEGRFDGYYDMNYQVYRQGKMLKLQVVSGADRLLIVD
jgi:hypothetical protein